jgi:hypothetical protein
MTLIKYLKWIRKETQTLENLMKIKRILGRNQVTWDVNVTKNN